MAKTSHGSCTIFEGVCGNWEGSWLAKISWLKPTISLKTSVPQYLICLMLAVDLILQYLDLICEHAVFEGAVVLLVVEPDRLERLLHQFVEQDANPLSPTFFGT